MNFPSFRCDETVFFFFGGGKSYVVNLKFAELAGRRGDAGAEVHNGPHI